jgi:hypothetical protein
MRKVIIDQVKAAGSRSQPVMATPTQDVMDQLRKLGELHQAGGLTDDEFTSKKKELLDRL